MMSDSSVQRTLSPTSRRQWRLPAELILLIASYVTPSDIATLVRLTSVCRQWRRLLTTSPDLWEDVSSVRMILIDHCYWPGDWERAEAKNEQRLALLKLCEERAQGGLKRAQLDELGNNQVSMACLQLLERCRASLVDLKICETFLCHCYECIQSADEGRTSTDALSRSNLLRSMGSLQSLERLEFDFCFYHEYDIEALDQRPVARPKTVVFKAHHRCSCSTRDYTEWQARLLPFLADLTSEVEHLEFDRSRDQWQPWTRHMLQQRSQHLRTCILAMHGCCDLDVPLDFSVLETALFRPSLGCKVETTPSFSFRAPVLQTLRTTPALALNIECPAVTTAWLMVRPEDDQSALATALARWPELQTLTLVLIAPREHEADAREARKAALISGVLKPLIPSTSGAIFAPQLRHLGIMQLWRQEWHDEQADPSWPTAPWTRTSINEFSPYHGRWPLAKEILPLVQERRQLSEGRAVHMQLEAPPALQEAERSVNLEPNCSSIRGRCCPLETLKLAGFNVEVPMWNSLVQESPTAVTCCPNPFLPTSRPSYGTVEPYVELVPASSVA